MFLHKSIKLFGHLAFKKGGVLVKKNVTVVCLSNIMLLGQFFFQVLQSRIVQSCYYFCGLF